MKTLIYFALILLPSLSLAQVDASFGEAEGSAICRTCAAGIRLNQQLQPLRPTAPTYRISFYELNGNKTASGSLFNKNAMRAAMPAPNSALIKTGAWFRITSPEGKFVDVCVNDHLPSQKEGLDITRAAFSRLYSDPKAKGTFKGQIQQLSEPPVGVAKINACDARYATWHPEMSGNNPIAASRPQR